MSNEMLLFEYYAAVPLNEMERARNGSKIFHTIAELKRWDWNRERTSPLDAEPYCYQHWMIICTSTHEAEEKLIEEFSTIEELIKHRQPPKEAANK